MRREGEGMLDGEETTARCAPTNGAVEGPPDGRGTPDRRNMESPNRSEDRSEGTGAPGRRLPLPLDDLSLRPRRRETGDGKGGAGLVAASRSRGSGAGRPPVSDIRVQQALEHERAADEARALVASHLAQRDALVRLLYAEGGWSYSRLAAALGLTPELIAKIIRPQRR